MCKSLEPFTASRAETNQKSVQKKNITGQCSKNIRRRSCSLQAADDLAVHILQVT